MLKARPQLNGNTRADFAEAYAALTDAHKAIKDAASKVLCDVANGRNYQHLGAEADLAVIADRRRVQEDIQKALVAIALIASDIADACDRHDGEARP